MALTVDTFRNLAESSFFSSRDIVVEGQNEAKRARLGRFVFSSGAETNSETMKTFRAALEAEYGVFGTHAFDMTLCSRQQLGLSLRAADVKKTLSRIEFVKRQRWMNEMNRQLDTDPNVWGLSREVRVELRSQLRADPFGDAADVLANIWTQRDLGQEVSRRIRVAFAPAIAAVDARNGNTTVSEITRESINAPAVEDSSIAPDEPMGLRNFGTNPIFAGHYTSMEDRMKAGRVGTGLRVNRDVFHPVLLDKLKSNGVEPGFIYSKDWSLDDTSALMADIWSDDNIAALDALVQRTPTLREMRDAHPPATRRQLAMKAGRAFPAGMAAVAEYIIQRDLALPQSSIAIAFNAKFKGVNIAELFPADGSAPGANGKRLLAEVKKALFIEIRDAIMNEPVGSATSAMSPIFGHFADRNIVKLDYNEGDRHFPSASGSVGSFRLPQRVMSKFGSIKGFLYRNFRLTSADEASVSAVREALANDITRLLGVQAQELTLVRGEYSDGHPKLMLSAKFANDYHDLEQGFLHDGHVVAPPGDTPIEPLGRYKAIFLALADRDAIGSHGQNKGIVKGRLFAIDPGHSLEGNSGDLEIHDDLSFVDRGANAQAKRFSNFSVFDDDTRFAKFQGVLKLREVVRSLKTNNLFAEYLAKFSPDKDGISNKEKRLREKIIYAIGAMSAEFNNHVARILDVFKPQLDAFDALAPNPPQDEPTLLQRNAIETIGNLEKLTSPTRWTSPNGEVDLKHLAVDAKSRIPWKLTVRENGDLVYETTARLDETARNRLFDFSEEGGGNVAANPGGGFIVTVPAERRDRFFAAFNESNIINEKHADEIPARVARDIARSQKAAEELARRALQS